MSWTLDLIPRQEGESSRQAINRVYAGGEQITFIDGVPYISEIPGGPTDEEVGRVTRVERAWMLLAVDLLEKADPPMVIDELTRDEGRRWPWCITLAPADESSFAVVYSSSVTLGPPRPIDNADDFAPWWRLIQAFARKARCVAYSADDDYIFSTRMPAAEAYKKQWQVGFPDDEPDSLGDEASIPEVDDSGITATPAINLCVSCTHMHQQWRCDAYPAGIPMEIMGGFDHRKPFGGEHGGILYEMACCPTVLMNTVAPVRVETARGRGP